MSIKYLFENIQSKQKNKGIEQVKNNIIDQVHHTDLDHALKSQSEIIGDRLNKDNSYLGQLFSDLQRITIEKYYLPEFDYK